MWRREREGEGSTRELCKFLFETLYYIIIRSIPSLHRPFSLFFHLFFMRGNRTGSPGSRSLLRKRERGDEYRFSVGRARLALQETCRVRLAALLAACLERAGSPRGVEGFEMRNALCMYDARFDHANISIYIMQYSIMGSIAISVM